MKFFCAHFPPFHLAPGGRARDPHPSPLPGGEGARYPYPTVHSLSLRERAEVRANPKRMQAILTLSLRERAGVRANPKRMQAILTLSLRERAGVRVNPKRMQAILTLSLRERVFCKKSALMGRLGNAWLPCNESLWAPSRPGASLKELPS